MNALETMLDTVAWKETPQPDCAELHATHEGVLNIAGFNFRCYQLSDGQRVFDAEDIAPFLGNDPALGWEIVQPAEQAL